MTTPQFTQADLMTILSRTAGLAPADHTDDAAATLDDVGLDSLAFLALQTELQDRYGFELPDQTTAQSTLGDMTRYVDNRLRGIVAEAS